MSHLIRFATAVSLFVLVALAAGCGSSSDGSSDEFRLGLEAPLSGEQQVLGQGMLRGAEMAAARLNEGGGIEGREVRIVPIDDAADAEVGVEAAEAAIEDGLDAVVGPYNSGVGIETLPLYIDAGLVPIRLTSDDSTNGLGLTLQPMTYQIAPVASRALSEWLGAKRVAIAYDPTQNYTVSVAQALKRSLGRAGVTVTAFEKVKPGEDSYAATIEALAATKPDAIYSAVYFPEGGLIAKEMQAMEVDAQCVADYGSYDTGFVETAGIAAARACPVVGVPAPQDFNESEIKVAEYEDEFEAAPGTWSPYTFDSVRFLAAGIERAEGSEAAALTKALKGLRNWKGWTGSVTIDPETGNREPATVVIADTNAQGELHVDPEWAKAVDAPYSG